MDVSVSATVWFRSCVFEQQNSFSQGNSWFWSFHSVFSAPFVLLVEC